MKVRYIGKSGVSLTNGRIYDGKEVESGWYRIVDDTEEDYLFPPEKFEIVTADSIFNENMTRFEARSTLFAAVDGKTRAEIEELFAEYAKVLPAITERETKLAEDGWMF